MLKMKDLRLPSCEDSIKNLNKFKIFFMQYVPILISDFCSLTSSCGICIEAESKLKNLTVM